MPVELPNRVHWISECYPHEDAHEHVAVYVIADDDGYIAVDSGSFYHRDAIKAAIDELTDGVGLDGLLLSHSDYPHAGNIDAFRDEWGDLELVASSGSPELQGLSHARQCKIGGQTEVLGRPFHFIDPPLADRSHSTWIYDPTARTLFTADGFGAVHAPGACESVSSDYADGIHVDDIYAYHKENLVWLRYVDPDRLQQALERVLDQYDIETIAPVHGPPIIGDDIPAYFDRLREATGRISGEYEVPTT